MRCSYQLCVTLSCCTASAVYAQLDEQWTATVAGQTVQVNPNGTFWIPNVAAADQFGEDGPGTDPDFLSDEFIRVVAFSEVLQEWAFSDLFQITNGETYFVQNLTFTTSPPPLPESLRFVLPQGRNAILEIEQTLNLQVLATLVGGEQEDVTCRTEWTTYRISNTAITTIMQGEDACSVENPTDGIVTGQAPGTAFITATNGGATAVIRIDVSTDTFDTTVEGFLRLPTGAYVQGASVAISRALPGLLTFFDIVVSNEQGRFIVSLEDQPIEAAFSILVQATADGQSYAANVDVPSSLIVDGGITDAGIIVLSQVFSNLASREVSVYRDAKQFGQDAISREVSVYRQIKEFGIDAISREVSVLNE